MTKDVPPIGRRLLGRLLHRAILHGLRAPRIAHEPALSTLALPGGRAQALRLPGPGGRSLAAWLVGEAVLEHVQAVIGVRFDDIAPLHTIRALRCPVLLVHGRDDTTVPFDDALRLQQAACRAELLGVDGGHDLREALAPHQARIVAFLAEALS